MKKCCLCGLTYERIGNNPAPPAGLAFELERVTDAMLRIGPDQLHQAALAAICASRGPVLWVQRQRERAQLMELIEREGRP
jgi:hypothetical protein